MRCRPATRATPMLNSSSIRLRRRESVSLGRFQNCNLLEMDHFRRHGVEDEPGCGAANDTARRCVTSGNDPLAGVLLAGDRRSEATAGQPGILSVPPPQTPTCRLGTIAPIPSPERNPPPTQRAFGADD